MEQTPLPSLWLRVSESRDGMLDSVDAVIPITPAWAEEALGRVRLMAALRQLSKGQLFQMEYWDFRPHWLTRMYDPPDALAGIDALYDDIEANEAIYLQADPWPVTYVDARVKAVRGPRMCVQEDGISWTCHVKHCDIALTTAEIPLRDLERYARGELPESAVVVEYGAAPKPEALCLCGHTDEEHDVCGPAPSPCACGVCLCGDCTPTQEERV